MLATILPLEINDVISATSTVVLCPRGLGWWREALRGRVYTGGTRLEREGVKDGWFAGGLVWSERFDGDDDAAEGAVRGAGGGGGHDVRFTALPSKTARHGRESRC